MSNVTLINAKFQDAIPKMDRVKMIFADPPDNIRLGYGECDDDLSSQDYWSLLSDIFRLSEDKCDVLWLSFNVRHLMGMSLLANSFIRGGWEFKPCVQIYTFGQHNSRDLGNNYRPLWRFMRKGAALYPDAVRVPSWRQLNGDKRADPRGRVPSDVFDFPRVVGNSKQRRKWHPTQLHEGLYERCIRLTCAPDEPVCDIFAGTGTLARACKVTHNPCTLIEMDTNYCEKIALEHELQYTSRRPFDEWTSKES
jgi:DNA modification methylase